MSSVLTKHEQYQAYQSLFDELAYALKRTDAAAIKNWGEASAKRFVVIGNRRVRNAGNLVYRLSCFLKNELVLAHSARRQRNLGRHLVLRAGEGFTNACDTSKKFCKIIAFLARALRDDPQKNAAGIMAIALGFFAGSGGFDGDGGIPDLDIKMLGIEGHRSILFHSIISGMLFEGSILALADLVDIIHDKLPPNAHSTFWDTLRASKQKFANDLTAGLSAGIAYHLAVDATIQPAAYKDLPVSMSLEAHQALFGLNAAVEGQDAFSRNNSKTR